MPKKYQSFMALPEAPEEWLTSGKLLPLALDTAYYHEAGKTRTEHWGLATLKADEHFVVYRYLKDTSFHYGG